MSRKTAAGSKAEKRSSADNASPADAKAKSASKAASKAAGGTASKPASFTDEERAAMQARAEELKAESRRGGRNKKAEGERDLKAKIAEMPEPDRGMATRIHAIVMDAAPDLEPKTWYGMPAYAKDGKVVCFFQGADKFKARYATLGFNDAAKLDDGDMWPTSFALKELTTAGEKAIRTLVKKAAG